MRHTFTKIITLGIFTLLCFSLSAQTPTNEKQQLALKVTKILQHSDKEAFHLLINPIVNGYNTSKLGLSNQQSAEFKQQLTADLTTYLSKLMLETRIETFDEKELRALAAHYDTPIGKKIAQKLPLIRELQAIEPLDEASMQILTKDELAYAKRFAATDMGKAIANKTRKVNETLLTKVSTDHAIQKQIDTFSGAYLNQLKQKKN